MLNLWTNYINSFDVYWAVLMSLGTLLDSASLSDKYRMVVKKIGDFYRVTVIKHYDDKATSVERKEIDSLKRKLAKVSLTGEEWKEYLDLGGNPNDVDGVIAFKKGKVVFDQVSREKSDKRARAKIKEHALRLKVDRMLTLTFHENITDLKVAFKAFEEFTRLMRKRFGKFEYVCVPERQKRGAVHFHLGLNKFYDWYKVLAIWKMAIKKSGLENENFEKIGGIFINRKVDKYTKLGVARYIAKYIGKEYAEKSDDGVNGALVGFNAKRYFVSKSEKSIKKVSFVENIGRIDSIFNAFCVKLKKMSKVIEFKPFLFEDFCGENGVIYEFEVTRGV